MQHLSTGTLVRELGTFNELGKIEYMFASSLLKTTQFISLNIARQLKLDQLISTFCYPFQNLNLNNITF